MRKILILDFSQPDKPEVRLMFPGASDTAQLASGIEKLRERIKDRSLITCLARPFSTSSSAGVKARQNEEKARSLSSYRNIRSKVDTSLPKSFSNRSNSLTRPKKASKPVVVQIEISPKEAEKPRKPQKPEPPKRRGIDAATSASASKKSPPVDYSTKALKRQPKKTAASSVPKKTKKDGEMKARKRPSSIPLKASKIDMHVPPQHNGKSYCPSPHN